MEGRIVGCKRRENGIEIQFQQAEAIIKVIRPDIINIYMRKGEAAKKSRAVERQLHEKCDIGLLDEDGCVTIKTGSLCIKVFDDFKIDFYNNEGSLLCSDYRGKRRPLLRRGVSANEMGEGLKLDKTEDIHNIEVLKHMLGGECFYGLGEKAGCLNKYGSSWEMWNSDIPAPHVESMKSLYKSIPFFITLRNKRAFGIFFDNTYKTYFDLGKESPEYYYFASDAGELNYYFIYGPGIGSVVSGYTYITGTTPLPQIWALGYQQSRWGYSSSERVMEIAENFRNRKIPCDIIHLDIDYMDGYKVFTWDEKKFKNHKKLVEDLNSRGFKVVTIIDPGVKQEKGYDVYDEGTAGNYFVKDEDGRDYINKVWPGDSAFPDFTDERVRKWWGKKHKAMVDWGVSGIWNDMNEPASFNGPLPDDILFKNDGSSAKHREVHNVYGHLMSKSTYEGLKEYTGKRPFVLTRACYSGTQKYSAVWTGDNHSFWEHLRMSIPMLLNLGLSGMAFCGADVGGFQFDCTPELLSRWVQIGCFTPFFRNHSCVYTRDQEPWAFDKQTEDINRKYIELRYRLIPYFYGLMREAERDGLPVMRPLFMHYQEDSSTYEINDQFLIGQSVLVAPVVSQGQNVRQVYLPSGAWVDLWEDKEYEGGRYILFHAPIDICPVFVKKGSIIPNWPVQQYIGEREIKSLILHIYAGNGEYQVYEDNGEDFSYLDGEYNSYNISMELIEDCIKIEVTALHNGYNSGVSDLEFVLHLSGIRSLYIDNKPSEFHQRDGKFMFKASAGNHSILIHTRE